MPPVVAWANRLLQTGDTLSDKKHFDDFSCLEIANLWDDDSGGITSRSSACHTSYRSRAIAFFKVGWVESSRPTDYQTTYWPSFKKALALTQKSIANNPDINEGMLRQQVDAAISEHADTAPLFDKPHEDNSKVRVTEPFTVESLSPHRSLTVKQKP